MSDETELNEFEPEAPEAAPVVEAVPKASSGDFLSTGAGKAVLIAGAALILLVVAGVVGWFVLGPAVSGTGTPTVVVPSAGTPVAPSTPSGATTPSVITTLPPANVTSRDVFTPRNPFTVIKASVIPPSTSDNGTGYDPDAVVLKDIITENSVRKAVIAYNGNTYTLAAGDAIPGTTDWKIVTVNTGSVVVLFGDVSVTLKPGQGTSK